MERENIASVGIYQRGYGICSGGVGFGVGGGRCFLLLL